MIDKMLYKYGMFSEYIPPCFNSIMLYEKIGNVRTSYETRNISECVELPIYKTDITRRIIKVPNPEQYVYLCEELKKNISYIERTINSNANTESNPFRLYKGKKILDIPLYCELKNISSRYSDSLKCRIRYSMGYKYQLKIDISKFYDSIYTHIIEWCVSGVKKKGSPNWGTELDYAVRSSQLQQTKGIPTGPFTSRIISEFILASIDNELKEAGMIFKHYVDDYKFYFRTESEAIKELKIISYIFSKYKLELNDSKTKIDKYPYDIQSNLNQITYVGRKMSEKESIIYIINECNRLYNSGEQASYKYILKTFQKLKKGDLKQWPYIESFFLSILTIKPDLARFISKIILDHQELISEDFVEKLKEILVSNIEEKNECEVLWILWLLIHLNAINYDYDILYSLLQIKNDFILVMVIDFIKGNGISNDKINSQMSIIEKYLENTEFSESNWLLLYEAVIKKWFKNKNITNKKNNNKFFKVLISNKIDFYVN